MNKKVWIILALNYLLLDFFEISFSVLVFLADVQDFLPMQIYSLCCKNWSDIARCDELAELGYILWLDNKSATLEINHDWLLLFCYNYVLYWPNHFEFIYFFVIKLFALAKNILYDIQGRFFISFL